MDRGGDPRPVSPETGKGQVYGTQYQTCLPEEAGMTMEPYDKALLPTHCA